MTSFDIILSFSDVNAKGFDGENALQMAAKFGNTEVAEILLDSKCHVNEKDDQGRTPLHHGCRRGNLDVVTVRERGKGKVCGCN